MLFRLEKATDSVGDYAKFVTIGNKWDAAWIEMLDSLRLRIAMEVNGKEILLDGNPNSGKLGATDLVPIRWRVEETVDFNNQPLLQEIIYWQNTATGDTGNSIYSLIPY